MAIFPRALRWFVVVATYVRASLALVGGFGELFGRLFYDVSTELFLLLAWRYLGVRVGGERTDLKDRNFCVA